MDTLIAALPTLLMMAFLAVIAIAVVIRVVLALVRRRSGGVRAALSPLAGAGAAQSSAYGWRPTEGMTVAEPPDEGPLSGEPVDPAQGPAGQSR